MPDNCKFYQKCLISYKKCENYYSKLSKYPLTFEIDNKKIIFNPKSFLIDNGNDEYPICSLIITPHRIKMQEGNSKIILGT